MTKKEETKKDALDLTEEQKQKLLLLSNLTEKEILAVVAQSQKAKAKQQEKDPVAQSRFHLARQNLQARNLQHGLLTKPSAWEIQAEVTRLLVNGDPGLDPVKNANKKS